MRRFIAAAIALAAAPGAMAGEVLFERTWDGSSARDLAPGVRIAAPDSEGDPAVLAVESDDPGGLSATVLTIPEPGVSSTAYALVGTVRTEGVEGEGYLEMWSAFPGRGRFFSRGLDDSGPARRLEGTSDWRTFALPFYITEGPEDQRPEEIELNVVLEGRGRVLLGPVRLVQYAPGEDPLAEVSGQWFPGWLGGAIGGLLGALLGVLGGVVGTLSSRGSGRRFSIGAIYVAIAIGLALAAVGVAAVAASQPYGVYYPLLLTGGICTAVCAGILPGIKRRYRDVELRRMRARDA